MDELGQIPVDDGIDNQGLLLNRLIQQFIDPVFLTNIAESLQDDLLVLKLCQGGHHNLFRRVAGRVRQDVDRLGYLHSGPS